MKVIKIKGLPPVKIPQDGTKIGVDQLKNIIDVSLETRKRLLKIKDLRDKGFFAKLFGGWFSFGLYGLQTAWDLIEAAPKIMEEIRDLDWVEIESLVDKIADSHGLDKKVAQVVFNKFKKFMGWLEDGVITLSELENF